MDKKNRLNGHSIRRILIAVFCLIIGTCVAVVMLNLYVPNKNALGALASVSMDVICMIILLILICSFAFDNHGSNRTTHFFSWMIIATIWAMFLDFLNWAFDGILAFGHLTYWFTLGSLCMGAVLAGIFILYLYSYMDETHNLGRIRKSAMICAGLNLVSFFMTLILALMGVAFKFVDGHYEIGALYDLVMVIPVLTMLYMTGYVIRNVKTVGVHDTFAISGYIIFMVAGALIEAVYRIGTTYVAVACADIFIFVMLQNQIIAQEKRMVQKWMLKSNTDELTGLYNRFAYETDMENLASKELDEDFVYISVDVNSLKLVNDSLGHYAGDELLLGAAECLKKCFGPYGKLYRIGGDEFIGLINVDSAQLNKLKKNIGELTQAWVGNRIQNLTLSCGYVSKEDFNGMTVREIAELADKRMYEAKNEYYRSSGIDRRKHPR